MNEKLLQEQLATVNLVRRFYYYQSVDSTMDMARRLLTKSTQDFHHGTLVVADYQEAGRGRHGRAWNASAGQSVLASLVIFPRLLDGLYSSPELPQLSYAIPVALCRALQRFIPNARIKYPNDIVSDGRKLCGILLESCGPAIIIGFGINCHQDLSDFPSNLRMPASSIFLETGVHTQRELVLSAALSEIQNSLIADNLQPSIQDMNALCESLGRPICVDVGDKVIAGTAIAITHEGKLEVLTETGSILIPSTSVIRTWPLESSDIIQ